MSEIKDTKEVFSRTFPYAKPRRWRNKQSGKEIKVIPWFIPVDDAPKFDFKGMMKDIEPNLFTDDVLAEFDVYSGLVMSYGWLMENESNVWLGFPRHYQEFFEDLGPWISEKKESKE